MIALSCKDLLLENGIKNITVSGIAGVAGIGKGTIYEYFSNKDEIVFEILNILVEDIQKRLRDFFDMQKLSFRNKLKYFLSFLFLPQYTNELKAYKEFLSISIAGATDQMKEHKKECTNSFELFLEKIIEDTIAVEELKLTKDIIPIIRYFYAGLVINSSLDEINVNAEIERFVSFIFGKWGLN